jgi:predicted PurR-regulated permease PerM
MKKIQNKHIKIAVIVVIAGAVLYAIMSIIDNIGLVFESVDAAVSFILRILAPVLIGFVIAFILSRPSDFFERLLDKIKPIKKQLAHVLGVLVAFMLFIGIIVAFFYLMVPDIIESVSSISRDIPVYAKSVDALLLDLSRNPEIVRVFEFVGVDALKTNSLSAIISQFWDDIAVFLQNLTGTVLGFLVNIGLFLYNFVLGLFFSIYMLLFKHELKGQLRTLSSNVLRKSHYRLMFVVDITDDMFYRFLVGKGICSIAVGILTFAICSILGFKYSPLISIIIAVTNMIPTFGPFIGAIPALLLSLMTAPVYALYMLIIIVVLQILDGNIIGPRVLGNSMGINGFWIIFSIIVFGALFGVIGMLIAAPVFGVLRILIKNWIYKRNHDTLEGQAEFAASMQRFREWTSKKNREKPSNNRAAD